MIFVRIATLRIIVSLSQVKHKFQGARKYCMVIQTQTYVPFFAGQTQVPWCTDHSTNIAFEIWRENSRHFYSYVRGGKRFD
jgi:hypothetical protein